MLSFVRCSYLLDALTCNVVLLVMCSHLLDGLTCIYYFLLVIYRNMNFTTKNDFDDVVDDDYTELMNSK